eukprot:SAG31_NODE_12398_length_944_cov_6.701775_1_plen_59_part_01
MTHHLAMLPTLTGRPLYEPPIQMEIQKGTDFLETTISTLWGYHLVCIHRNADSDKLLAG